MNNKPVEEYLCECIKWWVNYFKSEKECRLLPFPYTTHKNKSQALIGIIILLINVLLRIIF